MRILNLSLGQDTGGQQMRLQDAWPLYYPDDEYLSVTAAHTFYPIKHRLNYNALRQQWKDAEVLHVHNNPAYLKRFRMFDTTGKGILITFHGTAYRARPAYLLEQAKQYGALPVVTTIDLWALNPTETEWIPQAYQLHELQSYRDPINDGIFRIAHAPTNRPIKGTNHLIAAVERLQKEGHLVELDIIERRPNAECLTRKGKADLYVDQLVLGYGCNAVEAWGMGIPVIAGVDAEHAPNIIRQIIPPDTRDRMLQQWGSLPFMEATAESLYDRILQMITEPGTRKLWAEKGYRHFLGFHEALGATQRLRDAYHRTLL